MSASDLIKALEILKSGGIVGMPTETVYGLAASIESGKGLRRVFEIKERPFFDPLIVHVSSRDQVDAVVSEWTREAEVLAENFWPGPLTIIVRKSKTLNPLITSGLETVGVRCPSHPLAQELIQKLGTPVAAPSANKFGRTSPTKAEHVRSEFGDEVFVLDGGASEVGVESTVLRLSEGLWEILRPGAIGRAELESLAKRAKLKVRIEYASSQASPGHLETHYQPQIPLYLVDESEAYQWRGDSSTSVELSLSDDPRIAARELYDRMRSLSNSGAETMYFIQRADFFSEPWRAIRDRLMKASTSLKPRGPKL